MSSICTFQLFHSHVRKVHAKYDLFAWECAIWLIHMCHPIICATHMHMNDIYEYVSLIYKWIHMSATHMHMNDIYEYVSLLYKCMHMSATHMHMDDIYEWHMVHMNDIYEWPLIYVIHMHRHSSMSLICTMCHSYMSSICIWVAHICMNDIYGYAPLKYVIHMHPSYVCKKICHSYASFIRVHVWNMSFICILHTWKYAIHMHPSYVYMHFAVIPYEGCICMTYLSHLNHSNVSFTCKRDMTSLHLTSLCMACLYVYAQFWLIHMRHPVLCATHTCHPYVSFIRVRSNLNHWNVSFTNKRDVMGLYLTSLYVYAQYGVALVDRLHKIMGLFCKRAL